LQPFAIIFYQCVCSSKAVSISYLLYLPIAEPSSLTISAKTVKAPYT
jgi:hypothetical protein